MCKVEVRKKKCGAVVLFDLLLKKRYGLLNFYIMFFDTRTDFLSLLEVLVSRMDRSSGCFTQRNKA